MSVKTPADELKARCPETLPVAANTVSAQAVQPYRGRSWRKWAGFLLGLAISGVCIYWTLRGVDLARVQQELRICDRGLLILAVILVAASNLVRAVRWHALFPQPSPARVRYLFTSMMIGYLANNVLPARMGELVRIYVLRRKTGASKSTAAATIVLERILDALLLFALVALLAGFVPLPEILRRAAPLVLASFGGVVLFLVLLAVTGEPLARLAARLVRVVSQGMALKIQGTLERFVVGFHMLRSPNQGLKVLAISLVICALDAGLVWMIMQALHLDLPWIAALFVMGLVSLSFLLPAAPGGLGTYEFFVVTAVSPFQVDESRAVGLALVLHAVAYFTSTTLGLVSLWGEGLSIHELVKKTDNPQQEIA